MSNPLLVFFQLLGRHEPVRKIPALADLEPPQASSAIFLVMRRMRAPLIILIVIFSVSVLGLSLIPGVDAEGRPARLTIFDAFYFVSYTATTIGFGELPWPFTTVQRMWVTATIYLSVIGWAYAIGSLLTLAQDRAFRQALALQRFTGRVARLREPFFLVAGFGRAGELLAHDFDALGQQLVVVDSAPERIDALELGSYHADIPGLVADAANPRVLAAAGLAHPACAAVLALSNDDETNLAVTMAAALLRPDLPVVARTVSAPVAERMRAFGSPTVVNPFDRFGEHLRLALNAPCSYQLLTWLEAGPGAALPSRGQPQSDGLWIVCGYGRFGREVVADLRAAGLEVTVVESVARLDHEADVVVGDASTRRCSSVPVCTAPSGWSPARTTTRRTSRCWPRPGGSTPASSSPPGRTCRPARRCSRRCTPTRCWCPPRWSRTRSTRSSARRCCGASSASCRRRATPGPPG